MYTHNTYLCKVEPTARESEVRLVALWVGGREFKVQRDRWKACYTRTRGGSGTGRGGCSRCVRVWVW